MKKSLYLIITIIMVQLSVTNLQAQDAKAPEMAVTNDTLLVVWSSGDPDVAEKVCFMYTYNAKKWGWFKEVKFVIWGPSAKLLAENEDLQEYIKKMMDEGIVVEACIACARMFGVDEDLKELGIDVKGMGTVLTKYLKAGYPNITF